MLLQNEYAAFVASRSFPPFSSWRFRVINTVSISTKKFVTKYSTHEKSLLNSALSQREKEEIIGFHILKIIAKHDDNLHDMNRKHGQAKGILR